MTAVAGASTGHRANADRCVVPKVIRDNLKTAEKRLAAADCEVGRVTGPRTGIVSIAWPRAGRHEPTRSRIALTFTPAPASGRAGTASSSTVAPKSSPPVPIGMPGAWHLLLDSEFNGPSLNTSIWRTGWFGDGVTAPADPNQESCYSPGNVTFPGDGTMHLNITAVPSICGGITKPYTGAGVTTNPHDGRSSGGFQYISTGRSRRGSTSRLRGPSSPTGRPYGPTGRTGQPTVRTMRWRRSRVTPVGVSTVRWG